MCGRAVVELVKVEWRVSEGQEDAKPCEALEPLAPLPVGLGTFSCDPPVISYHPHNVSRGFAVSLIVPTASESHSAPFLFSHKPNRTNCAQPQISEAPKSEIVLKHSKCLRPSWLARMLLSY